MSNKRAELKRQQKEMQKQSKLNNTLFPVVNLKAETVSKDTGISLEKLNQWRQQEHDAIVKSVTQEYQAKLERAEDLIQAACVFAAINAVRRAWKNNFDFQKYFDCLMVERDLAFTNGIIDSARRAEKVSGLQFEFEDMDLNEEFHLGEWERNKKISNMTPNKAYDQAWEDASILGNVMHTVLLAETMFDKTVSYKGNTVHMDKEAIQGMIAAMNHRCAEIVTGDGILMKKILEVEEKTGIDFGKENRDKVAMFGL